ncbi:MAG: DNA helicase UvrD, partial [Spirochaetes bacterium]
MSYWAYLKGITVLGTGDFTHPGWLAELKEKLIPAEEGLYKLKPEYSLKLPPSPPRMQTPTPFSFPPSPSDVRFITTGEISNIYKKNGKVKKVHNLIFTPSLEDAEKVQLKLAKIGNISSDGRPILGLDSRDLLEIILDASENSLLVPAHIWTPWFSVLGSNSGFDSVEECYTDLSKYITAVETGLSSDPPMNRICSRLDPYILISNSDAHSPENIGREANLLNTEISYSGIIHALSKTNTGRFLGTIEFFPQEGKYHFDGHRKCGVCFDPVSTIKNGGYCPVCGKKLTIGVMNRVAQLADRENFENSIIDNTPFHSLIPLKQLLSEIHGAGIKTKKITYLYNSLIKNAGSELNLLLFTPLKKISEIGGDTLREGIRRMREREIYIKEGYDGEYGEIKVFSEEEVRSLVLKESLFEEQNTGGIRSSPPRRGLLDFSLKEYRKLNQSERRDEHRLNRTSLKIDDALSEEQQCAASHF